MGVRRREHDGNGIAAEERPSVFSAERFTDEAEAPRVEIEGAWQVLGAQHRPQRMEDDSHGTGRHYTSGSPAASSHRRACADDQPLLVPPAAGMYALRT
jgi:hypothetical protein